MNEQTYTVTAYYDTREAAQAGADVLKNSGIATHDLDILHGEAGAEAHAHGDGGGFMDKLSNMFMPEEDRHAYAEGIQRGGYVLSVNVAASDHQRVVDLLDSGQGVDLDERTGQWRQEGWGGRYEGAGQAAGADGKIEVAEEQLKVGKRDVSHGKVKVRSYTVSEDVSADVTLQSERAEVERHATDRVVKGAAADKLFQDKEIVVEESAEEAVVAKEAHVTEEIDVHKEVERHTETVTDTVRRTEVDIEREGGKVGRDKKV